MIRAFIATNIDSRIICEVAETIIQLRRAIPEVRWVAPDNIHLTVKFLGDIDPSRVDPIANALEQALTLFPRFTINAKDLGVFPDLRRPRVLWIGLEGKKLLELASKIETVLDPLGFSTEKRGFQPHLTIGRWRQFDRAPKKLAGLLEKWQGHEFGESTVAEVIFFQSELKREGAIYHPLKVVTLAM